MLLGMSYLHVNKHHVTQLLHCSSIQIQPGFGGRHPLPLKISHSHWRTWIPTGVIHDSLVPSQPVPKWHLDWLSRFCTANGKASLHFTTNRLPPRKIVIFHRGPGPHHPSPQAKRHFDRFSHFCRADDCDRPTD